VDQVVALVGADAPSVALEAICEASWSWRQKQKKSRDRGVTALEGDLRKALGRNFLRREKDNVEGTEASVFFNCTTC